jgi:hypothetical protein
MELRAALLFTRGVGTVNEAECDAIHFQSSLVSIIRENKRLPKPAAEMPN